MLKATELSEDGALNESLINGNITVPGAEERYWAIKEENDGI